MPRNDVSKMKFAKVYPLYVQKAEGKNRTKEEVDQVIYPAVLHPCIEIRWPEAGYESFSAYLTGLIRYDLMLLGPHRYFNGADTDRALLAALDTETVREFHANEPKRIRLDDFIEQSAGRAMTAEERSAAMRHLAATLREKALRKQKEERKGA